MAKKAQPTEAHIQEFRESVGMQIRTYRELKGWSQDELAAIMEVHRSTISKVETGKFAITVDYLIKFSWWLDFDISLNSNPKK